MVKHNASHWLLALGLLFVSAPSAQAEGVTVQSLHAPMKASSTIEVGQRFECLRDTRIEVYGCPILLRKGCVGLRVSEAEFFIARGTLRVGALPTDSPFGHRRDPLRFRFFRGQLLSTGLEWLSVKTDGEVRWQKEAATGLTKIEIDGVSCRAEENTLLVATDSEMMLFSPDKTGFQVADLDTLRVEELLLKHTRVRDAQAALSSRSHTEVRLFPKDVLDWEKERAIRRGRRYGVAP